MTITYYYRGDIERGNGAPGYSWVRGYSENSADGGATYPLMSSRECREDAKLKGAIAVFDDRLPNAT